MTAGQPTSSIACSAPSTEKATSVLGTGTPAAASSEVVTTLSAQLATTWCVLMVVTPWSSRSLSADSAWDCCMQRSRTTSQRGVAPPAWSTSRRTSTSSTSIARRAKTSSSIFSSTRTREISIAIRGSLTPILLLGGRDNQERRLQARDLEVRPAVRARHHLADHRSVVERYGGLAFGAWRGHALPPSSAAQPLPRMSSTSPPAWAMRIARALGGSPAQLGPPLVTLAVPPSTHHP